MWRVEFYFPKYFSPSCDLHPSHTPVKYVTSELMAGHKDTFGNLNDGTSQTCVSLFPGLNVHPCAAEGAIGVSLGAVQHLLQLVVSRFLGFHAHLKPQKVSESSDFTPKTYIYKPPKWWPPSPLASLLCSSLASLWCRPTQSSPSLLICTSFLDFFFCFL